MAAAGQERPPSPAPSSVPSAPPEEGSSSSGEAAAAPADISNSSQTALLGGEGSAALEEGQAYPMEAEASGPIHLEYVFLLRCRIGILHACKHASLQPPPDGRVCSRPLHAARQCERAGRPEGLWPGCLARAQRWQRRPRREARPSPTPSWG